MEKLPAIETVMDRQGVVPAQPFRIGADEELQHHQIEFQRAEAARRLDFADVSAKILIGRERHEGSIGIDPDPEVERQTGHVDPAVIRRLMVDDGLVEQRRKGVEGDVGCLDQ